MAPAQRWDADEAVTQLYAAHYTGLVRLAALLVRNSGEAEEIVQDAFVAMHGTVAPAARAREGARLSAPQRRQRGPVEPAAPQGRRQAPGRAELPRTRGSSPAPSTAPSRPRRARR